jgi:hypothetical protein
LSLFCKKGDYDCLKKAGLDRTAEEVVSALCGPTACGYEITPFQDSYQYLFSKKQIPRDNFEMHPSYP